MRLIRILLFTMALAALSCGFTYGQGSLPIQQYDVVVVGSTPGGIMAAIAAARASKSVAVLERSEYIGGLPANGLGATDIATRGATGGLFLEFVTSIHEYYTETYGPESQQVKDCSDGYHFEPSVATKVFEDMLSEHQDLITVRILRQFDALPENVKKEDCSVRQITILNRATGKKELYEGQVFIDATYEGDLAAAAGAKYRTGRESRDEFSEPGAGKIYKVWGGAVGEGSTGLADNAVQAYNYRLTLTNVTANMAPVTKPNGYNRDEYVSLIDDIRDYRVPADSENRHEMAWDGIGRIVNMVRLPNGKTDANNQHAAFISTDLPEENWPWPTAGWDWRDQYADRMRSYILGLVWFAQNDTALPADFRNHCRQWGLAKDEYTDNGNFPRQVYVREGRRIEGEYLFTAHDAMPCENGVRPPIHRNSITASHYALDSHAVLKREPDRAHLDGFLSYPTKPYTVPFGVMVPKGVDSLLAPVPVSGTHIGFSTLRMEPCWMAMGQAAGTAAAMSIDGNVKVRDVDSFLLQKRLLDQGAVLIYFTDMKPDDKHFAAVQFFALHGFLGDTYEADANAPVSSEVASEWIKRAGVGKPDGYQPGTTKRGELLYLLYRRVVELPEQRRNELFPVE